MLGGEGGGGWEPRCPWDLGECWPVQEVKEGRSGHGEKGGHLRHRTRYPLRCVTSDRLVNCIDTGVPNISLILFSCLRVSMCPLQLVLSKWVLTNSLSSVEPFKIRLSLIKKKRYFVNIKRESYSGITRIYSHRHTKEIPQHHFALKLLSSPPSARPPTQVSKCFGASQGPHGGPLPVRIW